MGKKRLWLIMVSATLSGILAGYLALIYLRQDPVTLESSEPTAETVVVAARQLPSGTVLRREDIEVVEWPGGSLPKGYVSSPGEVVGRGIITTVHRNEALLVTKLADKEAGGGLSIVIPEGKRAVSVEVDEVIGVAGFVLPGTRVDVLATVTPGANRNLTTTRIILQNIRVLTADQTYQEDVNGDPKTVTVVTLLVTPEQSESLTLAATEGKIQLALRNTLDGEEVGTGGRRISSLISAGRSSTASSAPQSAAPKSRAQVVETYRGGRRTLIKF